MQALCKPRKTIAYSREAKAPRRYIRQRKGLGRPDTWTKNAQSKFIGETNKRGGSVSYKTAHSLTF